MASSGLRWSPTSTLFVLCIVLAFMTTKAHAFGAGNIPSIGTLRLQAQEIQTNTLLTELLQPKSRVQTGAMETSRSEWQQPSLVGLRPGHC